MGSSVGGGSGWPATKEQRSRNRVIQAEGAGGGFIPPAAFLRRLPFAIYRFGRGPSRAIGPIESVYLTDFQSLGLSESLLRAVAAEGYTQPTPIQASVIPNMLDGRDVLGIAQTGTGKTAAFVLPLLHRLGAARGRPAPRTARALVLAPTRELASQIAEAVRTYGRGQRTSVAVVVGGARPGPQIRALSHGVDILVATPGRLLDHLSTGHVSLGSTDTLVLDEADQMLDLGFLPAIRKVVAALPAERQTLLLSATMPAAIRGLAADLLSNPAEVSVAPASRPIERIHQRVLHVDAPAKRNVLLDLLKGEPIQRAVVFTRTKRGADRLHEHLEKAGLKTAALHGNKSQGQRERALGAFRRGHIHILVATDIAARGIDVEAVSHVFNFDLPNVPEAYVHRIGRTGRAGREGAAVSLCAADERGLLRDIERLIGQPLERANEAPAHWIADTPLKSGNRPGGGRPEGGRPRQGRPQGGAPSGGNRRRRAPARAASA